MTRTAFLVKGFPRLSETFVLHELLELRRQGLDLRLFSVLLPEDPLVHPAAVPLCDEVTYLRSAPLPVRGRAVASAVVHHPLGVVRGLVWLARQRSLAAVRRLLDALVLVRACRAEGITHVHAHFASVPTTTAYLAKRVAGFTYSFSAHAKDVYTTDPEALRLRVQHASAVVTCTAANRDYFEDVVGVEPGSVQVMRHGVPTAAFTEAVPAPVPGRLLTVGRLVPKKGYDVVARAVATLVARGHDVTWHVVGGGPGRAALQELVADLGIADRVTMVGSTTSEGVVAELTQAQVFTMAPRVLADGDRDGIPNVVLEAMLVGVPVVTTAVSGLPEVVEDGVTGALVPPEDPEALADALELALSGSVAQARARRAREWALEHCDLTAAVAPLAALLREVAA